MAWTSRRPSSPRVKSGDQPITTLTLTIGAKDATDNSYYVKSSASEYIVKGVRIQRA
ncbi:hypothetical protein [Candidatus Amarolinea dominans]|uniref:hypothetical protein n=1 Tax=Candidatus Amarolinea dominans TaxID=3140696 RepID=UPI001DE4C3AF|nr:hypothetical protein [Anaerolineae bacterium]